MRAFGLLDGIGSGSPSFTIRSATPADAGVIARHRARMFEDMGQLPPAAFGPLRAAAEEFLALVLHASDDGRALYQRLGFVATNEMRFGESLVGPDDERS